MIDDTPTSAAPEGLRELPRKLGDQLLPGLEERLSALRHGSELVESFGWTGAAR